MIQKSISLVMPLHNEEENVPLVYKAVCGVFHARLPEYGLEIILINDGSDDSTDIEARRLVQRDDRVQYLEFTRNFGKEAATSAGIRAATGDAIIMLDADLQHPPQLIPAFVKKWERGAEVVVGVRASNRGEGFIKKYGSHAFYALMRAVSETRMESGETDFRLIDRAVADEFNKLTEHGRMTRSLINWFGFRTETIAFDAPARIHGVAAYSTVKLVRLAFNAIVADSLLPLRLAGYLGLFISMSSFSLGTIVFVNRYLLADPLNWYVSGPAQLAIITVFLIGVVLMALGVIALYIGKIDAEVTGRPLYVVRTQAR